MAKANAEATAERVDHLQGMILAGEPNTACLTYARQTWGVSRSQGYRLLKRAWRQIHDDIEGPDLDRQEMLAWCVQTLLETAGQAKAQRNPGAVVAAIRRSAHLKGGWGTRLKVVETWFVVLIGL